MKFENIVVSGITSIVIGRSAKWIKNVEDDIWCKENSFDNAKSHTDMMTIVNHLKVDRRYRMWVCGNSLNIVRE